MGDLAPNIQLDVLFKRNQNKSSTSLQKNSFEEIEAPASRDPVYHHLQLYTQSHDIPFAAPADLQTVGSNFADTDDLGLPISGSYFGRTSVNSPIIRKFVQLPLVPVPTNTGAAFQAPGAIMCSFSPGFTPGEVLTGQSSGARVIVVNVTQNIVFWKAIVGIQIPFNQSEQLVGQTSGAVAFVQETARTCPYHVVLKHVIPYDYDNESGSYNYNLYTTAGQTIIFGNGSWLLDVESGVLTFYGTLPPGVSTTQPPLITCYTYVGKIGLNTVHAPNGCVGIGTETPQVSLDICQTDALGLPAGSTAQRPSGVAGYIRYNNEIKAFEGYSQGTWSPLGASTQTVSLATGSITGSTVNITGSGSIGSNLYVNGTVIGQSGSFSGISIGTLNSSLATISTLTVNNVVNAASLTASTGSFSNLVQTGTVTGMQGSFSGLTSGNIIGLSALISSLLANTASITSLTAGTVSLTQFNAQSGNLTSLTSTYGSIQTLQAGSIVAIVGNYLGSLSAITGSFTQITTGTITGVTGSISAEFNAGSVFAQYGSFTQGLNSNNANIAGTVSALTVNGSTGSFVNVLAGSLTAVAASITKVLNAGTVITGSLSSLIASLTTVQAGYMLTSNATITGSIFAQTFLSQSGSVASLQVGTLTGKTASVSGLLQGSIIQGLQVVGTLGSFFNLQASSLSASNASFSGSVLVNNLTALSITGSTLLVDQATINNLSIGTASLTGDLYGTGGLFITQAGSFLDDVAVSGSFSVQGAAFVRGPMRINEDMAVGGGVVAGSLQILDAGSFGGDLTVGGAVSAHIGVPTSQLNYGPSNFADLADSDFISDALLKLNNALQTIETQVTNQVSSGGTTSQVGSILSVGTLYSTALSVNNYASIGGDLGINGNVVASGNFTVQGTFTANQTVYNLLTAQNANVSGSISAGTLLTSAANITGNLSATSLRIASNSSFLSGLSVGSQLQAGSGSVTGSLSASTLQAKQGIFTTLSAVNAILNSGSVQQLLFGTALGVAGSFASQVQTSTLTADSGNFLSVNITQNITGVNGSFSGTLTAAAIQTPSAQADSLSTGSLNASDAHVSNNLDVGSQVSAAYGSLSNLSTGDFHAAGDGNVAGDLAVGQQISAQNAEVSGTLSAFTIDTGSLYSALGSFAGSLFGQSVQASIGTFTSVQASTLSAAYGLMGNLLAASASITGSLGANALQAQSASVTGSLVVGSSVTAMGLSLTSALQASSAILSGSLVAQQVQAASVSARLGSFTNMLVEASMAVGSVSAGSISTTWMNAATSTSDYGSFTNVQATQVQSDAVQTTNLTVLNSGSFLGTLSANQSRFSALLTDTAQVLGNLAVNGTMSASMSSFVKLQAQDGSLSSLLVGSITASGTVYAQAGSFAGNLSSSVLTANIVTGSLGSFTNITSATLTSGRQIVQGNLTVGSVATLGTVTSALAILNTASITNNVNVIGTVVSASANISTLQSSSFSALTGSITNSLQVGSVLTQYASITGNLDIGSTIQTGTLIAGIGQFSNSLTALAVFATSSQILNLLSTGTIQAVQATISSTVFTGTIQTTVGSASSFQMASLVTDSAQVTTGSFQTLYGSSSSLTNLTAGNLYGTRAVILGSLTAVSGSFSSQLYSSAASLSTLQSSTVTVNQAMITTLTSTILTSLYGSITTLTSTQFMFGSGSVTGDMYVGGNMIVQGTLTQLHMTSSETTQLHVDNVGTGPGLYVVQTGGTTVADFYSGSNLVTSIRPDGVQASTITAQVGSLSDLFTLNGSLSSAAIGTLTAGPTTVSGNLTVTGTTTFQGPVQFSGTHLDKIGTPTLAPDYGQPNYLGLTAADLISDALYKINRELGTTHLPPPGGLCSLWQAELRLTSATLTACFAGTSSLTNCLICEARPACVPLANLYDGADGTLTALLSNNGLESCIGSLVMNNVPLQLGSCAQELHVWNKHDFYPFFADLAGKWYGFSCQVGTLSTALASGSNLYNLRLSHSRSGDTNAVEFYVDDSVTPKFVSPPELTFGTQVTWLSGVQTFNTLTTVTAALHVSGCIQAFYNSENGLGKLSGASLCEVNEASQSTRSVSNYTAGSDQSFLLSTYFGNNVYTESASILVQCFNAAGNSTDISINSINGLGLRLDTRGRPSTAQVTSGTGPSPERVGIDWGMQYDHTQSLLINEELQFINGRYDIPFSHDFSQSAPAGSPDYTHVNDQINIRYATFKFSLQENTSNCTIVFDDQLGEGWGSGYTPASEMTLQIRVIKNECDSGWLDANTVFDGIDSHNGCLLAQCTTSSKKHITFGHSLRGDAYVRVGLLCNDPVHEKAFKTVRLVTEPQSRRLLNLGDKALILAEDISTYEAFMTGTDVLVSNMLVTSRPSTCPCRDFYDGNSGILSASISQDGGLTFQQVGSLDLSKISIDHDEVSEFLVLLDKADYFSDIPANKGKVFSATAKIVPTFDLAAGTSSHLFDLTHSKTGSARRVQFYVDHPLTPSASSISLVLQGPTRYLSGVKVYAYGACVNVTFISHNCVSYFYNASFGLAKLTGSVIAPTLERNQTDRDPHTFLPYAPQSLSLSANVLKNVYTEHAVFKLTVFNSVGDSAVVELDGVGMADLPIRIDTVSETCTDQVTSGMVQYPSQVGIDFGVEYNHEQSLLQNCELQLLNGAYQVPALVNYALYSLSTVDYTHVNDQINWRYATFTTKFSTPASGAVIKIYGLQGTGWGSCSTLATEVKLNLRIVSTDSSCPYDSGWLDCNAFYDGVTIPHGNGAPCLLAYDTQEDCKRVTFGAQRHGIIYVRIGLQCHNTQVSKSFRMIRVRPLCETAQPTPVCDIILQSAMPLMPAFIAGTDTPINDLCTDLTMSISEMYDVIVASDSMVRAEVCQDGSWNVIGSIEVANIPDGSGTASGKLLITNKEVRKGHQNANIDFQILQQTFAPAPQEYAYRLASKMWQRDKCCEIDAVSKALTFHVDQYLSPVFIQNPITTVAGDFRWVSGIVTPVQTATVTATATVFGAVSFFYNYEHGLARLKGAAIDDQDEKASARDPSQYVPFGTQTVSVNTHFSKNIITEDGAPQLVIYNVYGSYVQCISEVNAGHPIHVDTLSTLAQNQVSSGQGKAPIVFGSFYDHTESLSTNEELQLYGNTYQLPVSRNFSTSYPPGSPDYSDINRGLGYRYATFVYTLKTDCQKIAIRFFGQEGSVWQEKKGSDISIQLRLVGKCDSGWLDCQTPFDGINGMLLASSTANEKIVKLPHPFVGEAFLRIGLSCKNSQNVKFQHVTLLPILNTHLVCLRGLALQLATPTVSAVLPGGTTRIFVNNLSLTNKPCTLPIYNLDLQSVSGSLQAVLNNGTTSTTVGKLDLESIMDGQMVKAGNIINLGSFRHGAHLLQNIVLETDIAIPASQFPYSLRLQHILPGSMHPVYCSKSVQFNIDDPDAPEIVNVSAIQVSGATRQVSGVMSCSTQTCIAVSGDVAKAISMFYNAEHGIASLHGTVINTQDEIDVPMQNPTNYVANGTVTVALSSQVSIGYEADASIFLTAWNSSGASLTQRLQLPGGQSIYIDTLSEIFPNQVTSGSGPAPDQVGIDFGIPYDHSQSLNQNQELQLVGGLYSVPEADNFSIKYPPGSDDYSQTAKMSSYRYATFVFDVEELISHVIIYFCEQRGTGWGGPTSIMQGASLQLRIISSACDSQWMDCNEFFDGQQGRMIAGAKTNAASKYITLGQCFCGESICPGWTGML